MTIVKIYFDWNIYLTKQGEFLTKYYNKKIQKNKFKYGEIMVKKLNC